jgi:putative ABC transport system permease protein
MKRNAPTSTSRAFRALARLLPGSVDDADIAELCAVYDALESDAVERRGRIGAPWAFVSELPGFIVLAAKEHRVAWRSRRTERRRRRTLASYQLPYSEDTSMIESLLQDVRYAARALRKSMSYTTIAIATLALGIGANTAIFSVVYGVLLAPLPFADPGRIVAVVSPDGTSSTPTAYGSSPANFNDLRRGALSASHVAGFSTQQVTLTGQGEPESLTGVATVGDIFGVLGVRAAIGRTLTPNDDDPAAPAVAVLNHQAWQRLFGGDPSIVGKTVAVGRRPRVIVGVLPPDFQFAPAQADVWLPEQWNAEYAANRDQYYIQMIARLAPGRTVAQYAAELEAVASRLRRDHAQYNTDLHLSATSLQDTVVSGVRTRLVVLMGAVGFLLLITCANLANLALARASTRQGEFTIRRALGAGRARIVRQLVTESMLLATLGGIAGVVVGGALLRVIIAAERATLPRVEEIALDPAVLAFTALVSLIAGVAVGVFPALRVSGASSMAALRQGTRGSGPHQRARSVLVVAELAIALMLLMGAGLLVRSFSRLLAVNTGFATERLLTLQMNVGSARAVDLVEQSLARIRAVPGVSAASVTSVLPVTGRASGAWFNILDRPLPPQETPPAEAYRVVSPEYFTTMGIRLVRGRFPTPDDRADRTPAVVVNEALVKRYWPNEDPIGKQVRLGAPENYLNPPSTIVGIVGDTPDAGLNAPAFPAVFMPHAVAPWWSFFTFVVRTSGPPEAVTASVRRELRALFPMTAIRNVRTMDVVLDQSVAPARVSMRLIGAFAIVALITAALGVFGVLSFIVSQRTRELGIRMALGAAPSDVRRMVVAYGGRLALAGLLIGLAGSFALTRLIASMLFGIEPTDPVTFGAVSAILLGIGLVASWLPARRATKIDPIAALRSD